MIDLDFVIIDSFLIVSLSEEVIVALIRIENIYRRQRKEIEELLRDRIDQIRGDCGVGKRGSGKWVAKRTILRPIGIVIGVTIPFVCKRTEIAVSGSRRRNCRRGRKRQVVTLAQIVKEEEGLILNDWSTYGGSKLVDLLHGFVERRQICHPPRDCGGAIALEFWMIRIERGVLSVVIARPMNIVCP